MILILGCRDVLYDQGNAAPLTILVNDLAVQLFGEGFHQIQAKADVCGTWFAVRAAVATNLPSAAEGWLLERYPALNPDSESPFSESPCVRCADRRRR